ncbi:hypothetical protein LXL04_017697 [Taraxacum kok-saghyz]
MSIPKRQNERYAASTRVKNRRNLSRSIKRKKKVLTFKREQIMKTRTREQTWSLDQFKWYFCNYSVLEIYVRRPPDHHLHPPPDHYLHPPPDHHRTTAGPPSDHRRTTIGPPPDHRRCTTCTNRHIGPLSDHPPDHCRTTAGQLPDHRHHRTTIGPPPGRPSVHHLHPSAHRTTVGPPPDHCRTTATTGPPSDHRRTTVGAPPAPIGTSDHCRTTAGPLPDHCWTTADVTLMKYLFAGEKRRSEDDYEVERRSFVPAVPVMAVGSDGHSDSGSGGGPAI